MLDKLAAVGLHREFGESREQFSRRVGMLAPSIQKLTDKHLALALGSQTNNNFDAMKWAELRNSVAQEIGHNTQTWKRVVACINPFSWLLSK